MSDNFNEYQPKLSELKLGDSFEYDFKTWTITEIYNYDWGNGLKSKEYSISSGIVEAYLEVEDDDELKITFSKETFLHKLEGEPSFSDFSKSNYPLSLNYNDVEYNFHAFFDASGKGNRYNEWEDFKCWEYFNADETETISIEEWEDESGVYHGKLIEEFELSEFREGSNSDVYNLNHNYDDEEDYDTNSNSTGCIILIVIVLFFIIIMFSMRGCRGSGSGYNRYHGGSGWYGSHGGGGGGFGK